MANIRDWRHSRHRVAMVAKSRGVVQCMLGIETAESATGTYSYSSSSGRPAAPGWAILATASDAWPRVFSCRAARVTAGDGTEGVGGDGKQTLKKSASLFLFSRKTDFFGFSFRSRAKERKIGLFFSLEESGALQKFKVAAAAATSKAVGQ